MAITPVFCCGMECGLSNASNIGQHWIGGTVTFSTTVVNNGLRSLTWNTSAAQFSRQTSNILSGSVGVGRFYINITTNPSVSIHVVGIMESATRAAGLCYNVADGKYYAGFDSGSGALTFGATGITLSTGVWYCVDVKADFTANPWLVDVSVNKSGLGQASIALAASTASEGLIGVATRTSTTVINVDDVVLSTTAADYPIGGGKVLSYVPNADGTHTFTTTIGVRGTTAAPTGGGNIAGSTDSYQWINARPMGGGASDSTRLWNQQTNGSTLYGEVGFEDSVEVYPPRGIDVIIIRRDASTGTGDSTFKLNDNGTENTIYATGAVAGVASDEYHRKHYATAPSTGVAWTTALFNGVKFRFGYSADANPDHYCRGVMIEAEFPVVSLPIRHRSYRNVLLRR